MTEQEEEKIYTWLEQCPEHGNRFIIEGISLEAFHERAEVLRKEALKRGIDLGVVYHAPIKTGMIFVKSE